MGAQDVVAAARGERPAALPLPQDDDDAELVAAVRRGDDYAFERLYGLYHRRIAAYVRGMVKDYARAEDITQEVFISALRRLRSSEQDIALKPWLYEIARNACIDQYRRTQRAPEVLLDSDSADSEPLVSIGPTPEIEVDTKQKLDHLRHAFSGLSEVQHEVLVMRELEGRSYREIGERLNLTRPAVESALFRARRRLMEEYEELSSGSRCMRVQRAINLACSGNPGVRDRWRIASHVSHCHICRRHAVICGLSPEYTPTTLPARVAAVLPLPAFLRRFFISRTPGRVGAVPAEHVTSLANMASAISSASEPISGWITAGAVAATVALAVGGSSLIGNTGTPHHRATPASLAPAAAHTGGGPAATSHASTPSASARLHQAQRGPATAGGTSSSTSTGTSSKPHVAASTTHPSQPTTTSSGSGGPLAGTPVSAAAPSSPVAAPPVHPHLVKTVTNTVGAAGQTGSSTTDTSKSVPSAVTNTTTQVQKAVDQATQTVQNVTSTATSPVPPPVGSGG